MAGIIRIRRSGYEKPQEYYSSNGQLYFIIATGTSLAFSYEEFLAELTAPESTIAALDFEFIPFSDASISRLQSALAENGSVLSISFINCTLAAKTIAEFNWLIAKNITSPYHQFIAAKDALLSAITTPGSNRDLNSLLCGLTQAANEFGEQCVFHAKWDQIKSHFTAIHNALKSEIFNSCGLVTARARAYLSSYLATADINLQQQDSARTHANNAWMCLNTIPLIARTDLDNKIFHYSRAIYTNLHQQTIPQLPVTFTHFNQHVSLAPIPRRMVPFILRANSPCL